MDTENTSTPANSEADTALADERFEAALAHHQAGRIAAAAALYRQVLQVDTEHPGALYLLGGMAYEENDYAQAFALVERALREQPDDPDALHLLGLSALRLGRAADAVDAIERALALRPDYVHAQSSLESALDLLIAESMHADQLDDAVRHLRRRLDLDPENFEALRQLGRVHTRRHEFSAAADCYRRGLALQPTHSELLANLAAAYQQLGETGLAIENYRRVLSQQPDHADIYCNLGVALQQQQDFDEALTCFRQAATLKPELALAHDLLGAALMARGRWQDAEASLRRALELLPERVDILTNLGTALGRLDRHQESEEFFRRALSLQPDFALASNNLGVALLGLGRHEEAAQVFETCLQHDPDNADARHMLASLRGETTDTAPRDYVENLFDEYAGGFEEHLVGNLSYRIPTLMRAAVDRFGKRRFEHALDLGCGTGLVGLQFKDIVDTLRGVDLSSKMLQQAERKGIYDHLYTDDVVDFAERSLREFPSYDLVASADVFIYVGKLESIFAAVRQVAAPGALFIFSVEDLQQGTFQIMPSGRYAHSADYIRTLAADNGFVLTHSEQCELRKERGKIIPGNIFVLTC
jgi:predicted TPR repeat methyltransferase